MHVPEGFAVVTPYIFVTGCANYIQFLETAFGAMEIGRTVDPNGRIANSQLRFDTSMIMLSEASEQFPPTSGSFYLYVEDADASMQKALDAGAAKIMDVGDMSYGDRQGGVRDPAGNIWWISQRLSTDTYF